MIGAIGSLATAQNVGYTVVGLLIYMILLCIYRVCFHPLSSYPGPLSYKISGWPLLWQAYIGDRHIHHLLDHEKYGPVVRISSNALSFNTASALHTIYAPRNANVQKGEWYKTFDIAAGTYSSFTETSREKHAAKRRWMGPIFSSESLKLNEGKIYAIIERFCETLSALRQDGKEEGNGGWSEKWNASEMSTYLGFDIMGTLVFGSRFETVQKEMFRPLANSVLPASMLMYWISYLPPARLVRPLLRTRLFEALGGKSVTDNNRLIDYGATQVQVQQSEVRTEKDTNAQRVDFLSRLVTAGDRKTDWHPSTADLSTESLNLMNAGADPFSGVLAGAIFYLVHNPNALHRATQEVRSSFNSPSEIVNGSALNSCTYLYAVIEETLRRTAPVPSHLPRIVLKGGMMIDGVHVPAGTTVGVPMYALHNDSTHFPSPFVFLPERWIESPSNPASSIALARSAFFPFSIGNRMCSGRNLAYMQLKLTLAHMLWRFDLRLAPDEPGSGGGKPELGVGRDRPDEFQIWDALGFGRDGPMVQVRVAQV
ncbi:hypothetical protein G6011_03077 [Alternaria panax]|uniref:Benzoate 4-monooxygenase cytochrome P450 n=1 Tax=Alternaria panax TaxID=48097 RepID=A0AAD4NSB5_9PLEO|nr:hypothetical protein G6011_03077 [Alternaria panax]